MDKIPPNISPKKLFSKINKTVEKYQMLDENDRVLVGLSGGKDSLVLLESLALKRKKSNIKFDIEAIYIDILNIPYDADVAYLKTYCERLGVNFIHEKLTDDVDLKHSEKNPCFLCSWDRRKHLFEYAKINQFNKLSLGHHLDDAIETLFMNMMYQANISALPPKLSMFGGQITVIRPLIETKESWITAYAESQNFKPMVKTCPFEKVSSREFVRGILQQMEDKYDRAKNNIFLSMTHIDKEYLP
jgi:tRNA(Ile)-lysidine synthase TilS/MesJ